MIDKHDIPHVINLFERFDALSNEQRKAPKFLSEQTKNHRELEITLIKNNIRQELYSWSDVAISIEDILARLQYGSKHFLDNGKQFPVWGKIIFFRQMEFHLLKTLLQTVTTII